MTNDLKLGMIGLDTSHVIKFAEILNDPSNPHFIPGARVTAGYPGGSPDVEASYTRVQGFTRQLAEERGVLIVSSVEEVAEACDGLLITSVDGRVHKEQFERVASYGKPVFIDKPFTCDLSEAEAIFELAERSGIPLMSCSVLRYLDPMLEALAADSAVIGADCFSPLQFEPSNPGWFWYGIHGTEMLYRILGLGCEQVHATVYEGAELVVAEWKDGRIGTMRGSRTGNWQYGAALHYANRTVAVNSADSKKPMAVTMLERIIEMFRTGRPDIAPKETLAIIRFIEAVNESRRTQTKVRLAT